MTDRDFPPGSTRMFCLGQAKSGTASLCGLLAGRYRAAHEPERERTLERILRLAVDDIDASEFRSYLIRRDHRLNLDYDIAWANQFIVPHLLTVFPQATFVVLIRDPYTWLRSMVGHLISRQLPPDVEVFLDWWFRPGEYPHSRHDRALETHGVYSISALLAAWIRHVETCTRQVPVDRRLVLRTHELRRSHQQLAEFLQIPLDSLTVRDGHLNRGTWSGRLDELVDTAYLEATVASTCGEAMSRYFPEVSGIADARQLWNDRSSNSSTS